MDKKRRSTRGFILSLIGVTLLTLSFVLSMQARLVTSTPLATLYKQLKTEPQNAQVHAQLVQLFLGSSQIREAEKELLVAKQLSTSSQVHVLGASQIAGINLQLAVLPEQRKNHRTYWEKVTTEHPLYKDAWVQLLYITFNEGENKDLSHYAQKITALDPNGLDNLPEEIKHVLPSLSP